MKIPNVIRNYWDYGIVGVLLLLSYPIPNSLAMLYNLNLAFWCIITLCIISEVNGRRQAIKKATAYYMLDLSPKKQRRLSIDQMAYVVFTVAVIVFFAWLVVFA